LLIQNGSFDCINDGLKSIDVARDFRPMFLGKHNQYLCFIEFSKVGLVGLNIESGKEKLHRTNTEDDY